MRDAMHFSLGWRFRPGRSPGQHLPEQFLRNGLNAPEIARDMPEYKDIARKFTGETTTSLRRI